MGKCKWKFIFSFYCTPTYSFETFISFSSNSSEWIILCSHKRIIISCSHNVKRICQFLNGFRRFKNANMRTKAFLRKQQLQAQISQKSGRIFTIDCLFNKKYERHSKKQTKPLKINPVGMLTETVLFCINVLFKS